MILIVGCSFSSGWFSYKNKTETLHNDYCWYDELDQPYEVYSHPGGGIMAYGQCLQHIDLSKYSKILIQETFTPRIVIQRQLEYTVVRNGVYQWTIDNYFNNNIHAWNSVQNKLEQHFNFDWQKGISDWFVALNERDSWDYLNSASASHLDLLASQTSLPTYSFSLTGVKYPYKYIEYLNVNPENLFYKLDLHNPDLHFTHKGNTVLGQMIKNELP